MERWVVVVERWGDRRRAGGRREEVGREVGVSQSVRSGVRRVRGNTFGAGGEGGSERGS